MSDDAQELVREGEIDFAKPIARALLRDARLSWGARGLFAFLWDLPRGWRPRIAHLVSAGPDGRDAVRARIRELEAVEAMRIEPIVGDGGRLAGKRWVLLAPHLWAIEAPLAADGKTEERKTRKSGNPIVGEADAKVHQFKVQQAKVHQEEERPALQAALCALVGQAQTRNRRSDPAADAAAQHAALEFARVSGLPDGDAAAAIDALRSRGGWPREAEEALAALRASRTQQEVAAAERDLVAGIQSSSPRRCVGEDPRPWRPA